MASLTAFLPERAVYLDHLATLAVFRDQFSYQREQFSETLVSLFLPEGTVSGDVYHGFV
jgi:hypothetical protein